MRTTSRHLILTTLLLTAVAALAQSDATAGEKNEREMVAHCAYTQADDACKDFSTSRGLASDQDHVGAQAQFPQHGPGYGPRGYPGAYGSRPYAYNYYDDGGSHAAIGALIGAGAGFALGAGANSNNRVGSGLIVGALGAVFGAAIGHSIATFPHHAFRRHRWSDEDDEEASAKLTPHDLRKSLASRH